MKSGYDLIFRDDTSKKSENGKSLENLKIENTRLLRWGRKKPTVLSYVSSYFCGLHAARKIRKSCFEAFHVSAVILRSLGCGNSWSCLPCRLGQLCWLIFHLIFTKGSVQSTSLPAVQPTCCGDFSKSASGTMAAEVKLNDYVSQSRPIGRTSSSSCSR